MAIKRVLGRRRDPETGRLFHLEADPPPEGEPGLAERLEVSWEGVLGGVDVGLERGSGVRLGKGRGRVGVGVWVGVGVQVRVGQVKGGYMRE